MKKAFTLVELMIVVVIIGILAAIAIPKFADMVDKSKEGATKGQLTALRGALNVYYSDNEGKFLVYPTTGADITSDFQSVMVPKYISEVGKTKLPKTPCGEVNTVKNIDTSTTTQFDTTGGWAYNGFGTNSKWGEIKVNCTANDLKGNPWTSY